MDTEQFAANPEPGRTSPAWSVSAGGGESWSGPEALRYGDNLPQLEHPLSPCPCCTLPQDEYMLFFHNLGGHFGPRPAHSNETRRPVTWHTANSTRTTGSRCASPLRSDGFDCGNAAVNLRCDLAMYSSFEYVDGKPVLVLSCPDRKYFLLGKITGRKRLTKADLPLKP